MKRLLIISFILLFTAMAVFSDITELFKTIDKMHNDYKHLEIITLIEGSINQATTPADKAGLYWRWARALTFSGDIAEDAGKDKKTILAIFAKAEEIGEKAIQFDPSIAYSYYWKSSAIGRWGQTKGILDSLFKAKPMQELLIKAINKDPEYAKAYQVLGMLYEALPGWPVSFGDSDIAVSMARKAVDAHEKDIQAGRRVGVDYSLYKELANELWTRNWSAKNRTKDQPKKVTKYNAAKEVLERNAAFEGMVIIPNQSDREEAVALLKMIIEKLGAKANKDFYETKDLQKTQELLKKWGG